MLAAQHAHIIGPRPRSDSQSTISLRLLGEDIDALAQRHQRLVDIASLNQPLPRVLRPRCPLTTRQINDLQLRPNYFDFVMNSTLLLAILHLFLALDIEDENGVRSGAKLIGTGRRDAPPHITKHYQIHQL